MLNFPQPTNKFIENRSNTSETISSSGSKPTSLYFQNCVDCTFIIEGTFLKLLIQNARNTTLTLRCKLLTSIIEVWDSNTLIILFDESSCKLCQLD